MSQSYTLATLPEIVVSSLLCIRGGRLLLPDGAISEQALWLHNGRIVAIGEYTEVADQVLILQGEYIAPGLIDLCARLGEPGQRLNGTIASESRAAAAGGFTHVCLPPDTQPAVDAGAIVALIQERAAQADRVDVHIVGAMTRALEGRQLASMSALRKAGCIGVGNARAPFASPEVLLRCLEYAASQDLTVFIAPEEASLATGCAHDGLMAARLGLPGIPVSAETVALATTLQLVEETGARVHFGQLSAGGSVALLRRAKGRHLPVSADVAMHHLLLTDDAIDGFNQAAHLRPPLRSETDRQALLEGLHDGTIDAICSDHQPLEPAAKQAPFQATEPGMSALETVLPLGLALVHEGVLSLPLLLARLSSGPARVLGLEAGRLAVGQRADLCLIDAAQSWQVTPANLRSAGHNTPYAGATLIGRVALTLRAGRISHRLSASV